MTKLKTHWLPQERRILNALEIIGTSAIRQNELYEEQQKSIKSIISFFEKFVVDRANDNNENFSEVGNDWLFPEKLDKIIDDSKYKFKFEKYIPASFERALNIKFGYFSEYRYGAYIKLRGSETLFHESILIPL